MREGKRSAKPAMLSFYPRYAWRHYVTDYGPEKRERGAQLLHVLCRATDPQEQDRIAKELDDLLMERADGRHLNRNVQPD
jgi:hypothetical protein